MIAKFMRESDESAAGLVAEAKVEEKKVVRKYVNTLTLDRDNTYLTSRSGVTQGTIVGAHQAALG